MPFSSTFMRERKGERNVSEKYRDVQLYSSNGKLVQKAHIYMSRDSDSVFESKSTVHKLSGGRYFVQGKTPG